MAYNNIAKTGRFDMACRKWRNTLPFEKSCEVFKMYFNTPNKDLHVLATTASSENHGTAQVATNADASLLAAMQAKLMTAEDYLDTALEHHNITPTASIANAASNVSVVIPTTAAPSASSVCSYWWTHCTTLNMRRNSATCRNKIQGHHDEATEGNKLGGSDNVYGGPRV
jgi:hypothetical protein